jgi:hypothetical protein
MYQRRIDGMSVIVSEDKCADGTLWRHVSVAHRKRYPTWDEIRFVKDVFIGKDKEAVQILPRQEDYVNEHPNCFHLWSNLTGDTIPGNPQREFPGKEKP